MRSLWRDLRRTLWEVLARPERRRLLFAFGPLGLVRMTRFLLGVVPRASRELAAIRRRAGAIPAAELRQQALASITEKAYHVQGGAILATFLDARAAARYVAIIAPLETIYDYLDNLCDRLPGLPPQAFAALHEALIDALDSATPPRDYYRFGPPGDDGGYLRSLVAQVRSNIALLPGYEPVREHALRIAALYAELQTFKHLPEAERVAACQAWFVQRGEGLEGLRWWEFAAACGSSLPIFALLFLASRRQIEVAAVHATINAYFPNLSAVHILLDYFIDQAEDRAHQELNFVACYPTTKEMVERMRLLIEQTTARLRKVGEPEHHEFLLRAMCLFYLTHPKVFEQRLEHESAALLAAFT